MKQIDKRIKTKIPLRVLCALCGLGVLFRLDLGL